MALPLLMADIRCDVLVHVGETKHLGELASLCTKTHLADVPWTYFRMQQRGEDGQA